jgi:CubicO group peptidase (beta-lactamase class C family)
MRYTLQVMKRPSALFVVVVPLLAVACLAQQPQDAAARVDALVQEFMQEEPVPALTVAIAVDGRIMYSKGFGQADVENEVKATPDTLIRTGSIAKPISAVATMTLAEAGKLDLDAPVQKYCPAFPQKQWPLTTRQVLGHIAGIRHYKDGEMDSIHHYENMSDGLAIFANEALLFEPGTKYEYSTYGYTVIGCVIEGASGEKFADYVTQHVLQPAAMTHTFIDDRWKIIPHRARPYSKKDFKVINAGFMDSSYKIPGGGLVSTAEDLVRFQMALMEGKLLKRATLDLMWTPLKTSDGKSTNYGLGFELREANGQQVIGHSGSQQGCSTAIAELPDKKIAVAVMANIDEVPAPALAAQILKAYQAPVKQAEFKQ